ncbi:leukosialin [Saccopteryx bilineata]|uniref:leukosialin n=1 Tax=Saccopteryx bilineata TaxID=59482 RepID=UPI00338E7764
MEMALLLLFFGGVLAQDALTSWPPKTSAPRAFSFSVVPDVSETPTVNSVTSNHTIIRGSEKHDSILQQTPPPSSAPPTTSEEFSPEAATNGTTITHEVSTRKSPVFQELSSATVTPPVPAENALGLNATTGGTTATSSLEPFNGTSVPPIIMTTSSLETFDETSEPPVHVATSSLEAASGTSGLPVTMATSSPETSDGTRRSSTTLPTNSPETSSDTSGRLVIVTTGSLETPTETSGSPSAGMKISIVTPRETSTNDSANSDKRTKQTLLVAVLVALLVVIVLLALLLLWRQRQKRRTGALTLSGGGKRNGVVDAWAGPARVSDEEAAITATGASGGDRGCGTPEREGPGRRPTLTTFFGRRKSRQGSLAMEEVKTCSASLQGEEEPLVGAEGEDGSGDAPESDGPLAAGAEAPQCL